MSKQVLLNSPDSDLPLLEEQILGKYRVWADGTVQSVDGEAYYWKSDDYCIVCALDEEHAYEVWQSMGL